MNALALLWSVSLVLTALSLGWMVFLIIARVLRHRRALARDRHRRAVEQACLAVIRGGNDAAAGLRPYRHRARLMAEVLLSFGALVRGAEQDRLVAACRLMTVDDRLRARLFRGSRAGRLASAEALALFPSDETARSLGRVLETTPDADLAATAVRSLVEIDRAPSLTTLLDGMATRRLSNAPAYLPALRRLVALSPDAALARLQAAGPESPDFILLAEAVAATGDYRAVVPLCAAAGAARPDARIAAIRGLGTLAHPAAVPHLEMALTDPDWEVRSAACDAIGRTAAASSTGLLSARLADPVWWVRFQAAEALLRLGPAGLQALQAAAGQGGDTARRAASLALAERGLAGPALDAAPG